MNGMDMMRVGVYEGAFAPIHKGHVEAAKAFMEQMKLDYLFVIPTYLGGSDDPLYRLKMCELAFEDTDGVVISDAAIARGAGGGLYDILCELQRPDTRLFLLFGTDTVLDFDTRENYEEILKISYPTYARREDDPLMTSRIVAKIGEIYEKHGVMFRRIVKDSVSLSSGGVRRAVKEGRDISGMVSPSVEKFIRDNRLYLD